MGAVLCVNVTAFFFFVWTKIGLTIVGNNSYNGLFFVLPFHTYKQWKSYVGLIRRFIKTTSFSKTYWLVYYKFRLPRNNPGESLPYFKFPINDRGAEFYNPQEIPGLQSLLDNREVILKEYQQASNHLKPYINEAGGLHNDWQTILLYGAGVLNTKVQSDFTETLKIITNLPGAEFSMVMFSVLTPGAQIPIHTGPFNAFLRVHVPLVLPKNTGNCTITVGTKTQPWQNNALLVFDDSFAHTVANNTNETRVILMLAVWKPWIPNNIKPLIKRFIALLNSSLPFKQWMIDNS